jgi:hypothetical protein
MRQPRLHTKKHPKKIEPVKLATKLDKNLLAYALAAGAAGVGMMAIAEPAEARVLAMPVNISIPVNQGVIEFDVNQDGVPDFGLSLNVYEFARNPPLGNFSSALRIIPAQAGNEVWEVSSDQNQCAAAVHAGVLIGARRQFQPGTLLMLEAAGSETRGRSSHCPWNGSNPPFLGLKFMIDGQVHFGWARVITTERSATLTGFAYETIPEKPIIAGATREARGESSNTAPALSGPTTPAASLGVLARGAR